MSQHEIINQRMPHARMLLRFSAFAAFVVLALIAFPRPTAQLIVAPALLFVAWQIRLFSVRIPLAVLAVASVGLIVGVAFRYSHVTLSKGAFLISTLSDQGLQQEAKIYRDKMRRVVGANGDSLIGLHNGRITQAVQARELLDRSPRLGGVVWGTVRWMTASLQTYSPLGFSSFGAESAARDYLARHSISDLLVVRSIPSVSISHADTRASIAFLAGVSRLWRAVPQVVVPGHDQPEFDDLAIGLGRMKARWTSQAHLAFPLWLAGTRHLVRALEQSELDIGELRCAVTQLKQAIKQCRGRKSPQLEAAARSNYALALLLYADSSPKRERFRKAALRHLAVAVRWRKRRVDGALTASHNLKALGAENASMEVHARRKR